MSPRPVFFFFFFCFFFFCFLFVCFFVLFCFGFFFGGGDSSLYTPTNHSHAKPRSIQNVHKRSFWFSIRGVKNVHLEFSELFSLKSIYVKYKNAILPHINCFFCTWKNKTNRHVLRHIFDWFYLDCLFHRSNEISGKALDHMSNPFMYERSNL